MAEHKSIKNNQNNTRTRIINSAIELFKEYGYDETTIPMICEKAGVSKTALHYYFPKKQDIFFDMRNNFNFFTYFYNLYGKSSYVYKWRGFKQ